MIDYVEISACNYKRLCDKFYNTLTYSVYMDTVKKEFIYNLQLKTNNGIIVLKFKDILCISNDEIVGFFRGK